MRIVCFALDIVFYAVILWVILSWVVSFGRLSWGHPVRKLYDFLAADKRVKMVNTRTINDPALAGAYCSSPSPTTGAAFPSTRIRSSPASPRSR